MADEPSAITPTAFYRDPMAALKWLQEAFGFEIGMVVTDDQGNIGHAEMTWRGAAIGVGGEWASAELLGAAELKSPLSLGGAGTQFLRIHLDENIDAHCERARAAGGAYHPGAGRSVLRGPHLSRSRLRGPRLELPAAGRRGLDPADGSRQRTEDPPHAVAREQQGEMP